MPLLTISEVARQVGIQPSAIRYYERIGLLPPAQRMSRHRRYDATVLYRLAIVHWARELGFTLDEIRQLFFGFRSVTRASERWQNLSQRKLAELDVLMGGIRTVRRLLKKMMQDCRCDTLDQCGKGIFRNRYRLQKAAAGQQKRPNKTTPSRIPSGKFAGAARQSGRRKASL